MLIGEFARAMEFDLLQADMAQNEIDLSGCYIGDLLSNVMGNAKIGQLWLTVMTNINVIAVAHLLELSGIVLLEGNQVEDDVLLRATTEKIPVFVTKDPAYKAAIRLHKSGLIKD
jgi:hexokinase